MMTHPVPDRRDPGGWVAPLLSTVVTLPAAGYAFLIAGMSPMVCDSCGDADEQRFDASFGTAFHVFLVGLVLSLGLLAASWVLPRRPANAGPRVALAALAPFVVLLAYLLFHGLVDWPEGG